jgi:glucose-1-phosphate cytidylyltransferase
MFIFFLAVIIIFMKVVILAGGLGSRLSEETVLKPKPMVQIGSEPILLHIMKIFAKYDYNDFIICGGYKAEMIQEYFKNFYLKNADIEFNLNNGNFNILNKKSQLNWNVRVMDTGLETMTGGRLKKVMDIIDDDNFLFTYGDGLSDINISKLVDFHTHHKKLATLTAVYAPGRFGALKIHNNQIENFNEKPIGDGAKINGGFFVLNRDVINYLGDDHTIFEAEPLERLAADGELMAFEHEGFWHAMDTLRDKNYLNDLWNADNAPWKLDK